MTPESRIYGCSCFAVRQAARNISKLYERHLAPAGITVTQFSVLASLDETPGLTMNSLAETLVMERTALLRTIRPLQRAGLLVGVVGPGQGRKQTLSLTPDGLRKLREAAPLWAKAQADFEALGRAG
jgi:DNA-binding MarR family transcriptional regulator